MEYHGKLYGKIGDKYFDTSKTSDDYDSLEAKNKAQLEEIERLKSELKAAEWISVEDIDKLPKTSNPHVQISTKYSKLPTRGYYKDGKWFVFYHGGVEECDEDNPVTHWMPLPNKPKTN